MSVREPRTWHGYEFGEDNGTQDWTVRKTMWFRNEGGALTCSSLEGEETIMLSTLNVVYKGLHNRVRSYKQTPGQCRYADVDQLLYLAVVTYLDAVSSHGAHPVELTHSFRRRSAQYDDGEYGFGYLDHQQDREALLILDPNGQTRPEKEGYERDDGRDVGAEMVQVCPRSHCSM